MVKPTPEAYDLVRDALGLPTSESEPTKELLAMLILTGLKAENGETEWSIRPGGWTSMHYLFGVDLHDNNRSKAGDWFGDIDKLQPLLVQGLENPSMKTLFLITALLISVGAGQAHAEIVINITESGSDVLFTTSGSLDTSGLTGSQDTNNARGIFYNNGTSTFRTWIAFGNDAEDFYNSAEDGLIDYASTVSWTGASIGGLSRGLSNVLAGHQDNSRKLRAGLFP